MERLATMCNPQLWITDACRLLEKLFDYENNELAISLEQRKELIAAFLTNHKLIAQLKEWTEGTERRTFTSILWDLASKWPRSPESEVRRTVRPILMPHHVYVYLPADDETKARVYRKEDNALCRQWIIEGCSPEDVQTIELGKKDKDKSCREQARRVSQKPIMSDEDYDEKQKQEWAAKEKYRQELMTFYTRLAIALIVVKLYFPEWSNVALGVSIGLSGILILISVFEHVVRRFQRKREWTQSAIAQVYLDDSLEKARDLLEKGLSPLVISKETGRSLKILKREGVIIDEFKNP